MYKLPEKISNLKPYEPITGDYEVRLDANESPFDMPEDLKEKIMSEIAKIDLNRYPDPFATKAVEAFAGFYEIAPKNVVAGNGSDELIGYIVSCFAENNDKICVLSNDFSMYKIYAELYGKQVVTFQKEKNLREFDCELGKYFSDYSINYEKLIDFCKENKVKILIFSNPCNPTSMGLSKEAVLKIVESLPDTLIVLDEAYMDFWDNYQASLKSAVVDDYKASLIFAEGDYQTSLIGFAGTECKNLLVLRTASKAFGLAGIRMGFAVASEEIITALKAIKAPYNTNSISQKIVEIIYSDKKYLSRFKYNALTLRLLINLSKLGFNVLDGLTNFIYFETEKATEIFEFLLENSIAVRCFGNALRITVGTSEENEKLIETLKRFNNATGKN
jgi:histidinol-phosphate aminotransferase